MPALGVLDGSLFQIHTKYRTDYHAKAHNRLEEEEEKEEEEKEGEEYVKSGTYLRVFNALRHELQYF
jgi:hypothetical protein